MFIKVVYSLRTAWVMANNFVSLYSHSPYLSCFYFMSPIEKLSNQHNKIPTYYFSLTLHVYSLIDNRAEIGHQCLIWQEKRECWGNEVFIHFSFENEFFFSFSDLFFVHKHSVKSVTEKESFQRLCREWGFLNVPLNFHIVLWKESVTHVGGSLLKTNFCHI